LKDSKLTNIFSLDSKVIVITGAAGLLGRKHAEAVVAYGGIPILTDISEVSLQNLVEELEDKYEASVFGDVVDVTDEKAVEMHAAEVIKRYGKIDGLVNNAANNPKIEENNKFSFSRLENFPLKQWNMDIAVGLTGAYLCAKHYGQEISINPRGGVIVNISSDLGLIAPDQRLYRKNDLTEGAQPVKPVTYSVIKSGLIGLTRYLATYWPNKIRCNALCPGGVEAGQPKEFIEALSFRIPVGRLASPDEVQGALIFLLSEASAYLNGAVIPIDGGRSAW